MAKAENHVQVKVTSTASIPINVHVLKFKSIEKVREPGPVYHQ